MSFLTNNNIFLIVIATAPIWLTIIGLFFNARYKNGGYLYGSIANAFFFEALAFLIIDIYLAINTVSGWNWLFANQHSLLLWIPLVISPIIAIKLNGNTGTKLYFFWFIIFFMLTLVGVLIVYTIGNFFNEFYVDRFEIIKKSFR